MSEIKQILKNCFENSNIFWSKDFVQVLEYLSNIHSKNYSSSDKVLKSNEILKATISNLYRYLNVEIAQRILNHDLREPLFVLNLKKVLESLDRYISSFKDDMINERIIGHIECDLLSSILECGFCFCVSIRSIDEAKHRIDQMNNRLNSKNTLKEISSILGELHGVRLSLASKIYETIKADFESLDEQLKTLELDLTKSIFDNFSEYEKEFENLNNNVKTPLLTNYNIHPATRRWLADIVCKWMASEKRLLIIAGKQGTGKSAICNLLGNLVPHQILAIHQVSNSNNVNDIINSISQQFSLSLKDFREFINSNQSITDDENNADWNINFNNKLKLPLMTFSTKNHPKIIAVLDSPELACEKEWSEICEFIKKMQQELPKCVGLILTVRSKYSSNLLSENKDAMDVVRLHDRNHLWKHLNDIEIFIGSVVGAILAGEHNREKPPHACSDEATIQKTVDELMRMSAGRFDYAEIMMKKLISDMQRTGQFLSSVKKASTPLRQKDDLQSRLTDFASPFRSYRDLQARNETVNLMSQPTQLMQKCRVALIRRLFDL